MHIHTKEMTTRVVYRERAHAVCSLHRACTCANRSDSVHIHMHNSYIGYIHMSHNRIITQRHTHTSTQREITEIRKRENNVDRTACGSAHVNDTYAQRGSSSPPPFPQIIHTMYNLLSRLALRPKICTVESILRRTPRVYVCVCVCICAYAGTHARVNSKQLVGRSRAC